MWAQWDLCTTFTMNPMMIVIASLGEIEPHIWQLCTVWVAYQTDCQIVAALWKIINPNLCIWYRVSNELEPMMRSIWKLLTYNSLIKLVEICKGLGLTHTWEQGYTVDSIRESMVKLWTIYLNAGAQEMVSLLFYEHGLSFSRYIFSVEV